MGPSIEPKQTNDKIVSRANELIETLQEAQIDQKIIDAIKRVLDSITMALTKKDSDSETIKIPLATKAAQVLNDAGLIPYNITELRVLFSSINSEPILMSEGSTPFQTTRANLSNLTKASLRQVIQNGIDLLETPSATTHPKSDPARTSNEIAALKKFLEELN